MTITELQKNLENAGVGRSEFLYIEKDSWAEGLVLLKEKDGYTLTLRERYDIDLIGKYDTEDGACMDVLRFLAPFYSALKQYESEDKISEDEVPPKDIFVTITGMNHRYGNSFVVPQMIGKLKITLEKEPDNEHDCEAIAAKVPGLGKIGYVANSRYTVLEDCYSAGRLYDMIGNSASATVMYKIGSGLVCRLDTEAMDHEPAEEEENTAENQENAPEDCTEKVIESDGYLFIGKKPETQKELQQWMMINGFKMDSFYFENDIKPVDHDVFRVTRTPEGGYRYAYWERGEISCYHDCATEKELVEYIRNDLVEDNEYRMHSFASSFDEEAINEMYAILKADNIKCKLRTVPHSHEPGKEWLYIILVEGLDILRAQKHKNLHFFDKKVSY